MSRISLSRFRTIRFLILGTLLSNKDSTTCAPTIIHTFSIIAFEYDFLNCGNLLNGYEN